MDGSCYPTAGSWFSEYDGLGEPGDLELITSLADGGSLSVQVRYAGALDICRVTGTSGIRLADPTDHEAVHELLRGLLHRPEG